MTERRTPRDLCRNRLSRREAVTLPGPSPALQPEPPRSHVVLGTIALVFGALLACLVFADSTGGVPFDMPRTWYTARSLWYLLTLGAFAAAWVLLRGPRELPEPLTATGSPFRRLVFYTRSGCHLCDDAKAILLRYATVLPEIEEVDIDTAPQLVERFGECVPVVEIDGRVRFRGRVNEVLLRRLLEGAARGEAVSEAV